MSIASDAQTRARTYDSTGDIDATARRIHRDLDRILGPQEYPNATLAPVDEVQTIAAGDRTGGTFDLDIDIWDHLGNWLATASLAGLAHNVTAATIQAQIDLALAPGDKVPNYVAGDLAVAGGPLGSGGAAITLTFGGSIQGDQPLAVINNDTLTGGTTSPSVSQTTAGVQGRFWFGALKAMGVIDGTDPAFQAAPAGQYTVRTRDQLENYPSNRTIRALIKEATVVEGQDWEAELLPLLGLDRLADGIDK